MKHPLQYLSYPAIPLYLRVDTKHHNASRSSEPHVSLWTQTHRKIPSLAIMLCQVVHLS